MAENARRPWTLSTADDGFHLASADSMLSEGSFFAFAVPERRLGGWIYHLTRPRRGTASGGCWIWDDSAVQYYEIPYYDHREHQDVEVTDAASLTDFRWPDGTRVQTRTPLMSYVVRYEPLDLELTFDGIIDPWLTTTAWTPDGAPIAARLDQPCSVLGAFNLPGERVQVDDFGFRDHSWGVRQTPEPVLYTPDQQRAPLSGPPVYYYGTRSRRHAFFVMAGRIGYLLRDGVTHPIANVIETAIREPATGVLRTVEVTGADTAGRTFAAVGRELSTVIRPSLSGTARISVFAWDLDGQPCHGEVQDVWPVQQWAASRRVARSDARAGG